MEHQYPPMDEAREYAIQEAHSANALLNELVDVLYTANPIAIMDYFDLEYPLDAQDIVSFRDAWNAENVDLLAGYIEVGNIIMHDPSSIALDQFMLFKKRVFETKDSIARSFRAS